MATELEDHPRHPSEKVGFALFLALVTLALTLIVWPFVAPLLWSALAAIVFQPLFQRIASLMPRHPNRAALATLSIIVVAVVIPAIAIGSIVLEQAIELYGALSTGRFNIAVLFDTIHDALPVQLRQIVDRTEYAEYAVVQQRIEQLLRESAGLIAREAVSIGGSAFAFVLALGVALYVIYFLLRDGLSVGHRIIETLPLERSIADRVGTAFVQIVRATIKGSVVVGLVQGALGAITFWIVGMPSAILFGLLMAIFSLLPALGPAIVWLPVAIYLFATGDIWQAGTVVASGIAVIGMADNVLRPILVGRDTGIPDWIVLITTLGGIASIGLSGIVLGPLAAGLFLAGWTIYREQKGATIPPIEI